MAGAGLVVAPAGWAVGLDVEQVGRVPVHGVLKVARKALAPPEVAALEGALCRCGLGA